MPPPCILTPLQVYIHTLTVLSGKPPPVYWPPCRCPDRRWRCPWRGRSCSPGTEPAKYNQVTLFKQRKHLLTRKLIISETHPYKKAPLPSPSDRIELCTLCTLRKQCIFLYTFYRLFFKTKILYPFFMCLKCAEGVWTCRVRTHNFVMSLCFFA